MTTLTGALRRAIAPLAIVLIAALAIAGASVATGAGDVLAKKSKIKVKCPNEPGKTVTCKVKGKLPKGPKGPKGATGAKGDTGPQGPAGVGGYELVSTTFPDVFVVNSGGQRGLSEVKTVSCPAGKKAIGGGADLGTNATDNGAQRQILVSSSVPNADGSGWSVQLFNNSTSIDNNIDLKVTAVCVNVD
jgi:hypothetical protein